MSDELGVVNEWSHCEAVLKVQEEEVRRKK